MDTHPKDLWCRNLMKRKPCADAHHWFSDSSISRSFGLMDASQSHKFVEQLRSCGAVQVFAVGIRSHRARPQLGDNKPSESADGLIVELPEDTQLREKLFAIEAEGAINQGFDPILDEGQTLLFLKAD